MNYSEDNARTLAFYHGVLSSMGAEARLRAKGHGHYLLRLSTIQVDEYVLSVLTNQDHVRHLLVPRTRRNDLIAKNNFQSLAEVVQFIVSTFNASDGQNLFQFQLNEEENDTEMRDVDAERFYDANACLVCHDQLDSPTKLRNHMESHRVISCGSCGICLLKASHSSH